MAPAEATNGGEDEGHERDAGEQRRETERHLAGPEDARPALQQQIVERGVALGPEEIEQAAEAVALGEQGRAGFVEPGFAHADAEQAEHDRHADEAGQDREDDVRASFGVTRGGRIGRDGHGEFLFGGPARVPSQPMARLASTMTPTPARANVPGHSPQMAQP